MKAPSQRLAEEAGAAGPQHVSREVYLAQRLATDRQLGDPAVLSLPIRSIGGPRSLRARLVRSGSPEIGGPLCRAIESLVRHYRDFGLEDCSIWRYSVDGGEGKSARAPLFIVDYSDRYTETQEYRSFSGHISYRAPFSPEPGTFSFESLSGEFTIFDVLLQSGHSYRVLIGPAPAKPAPLAARGGPAIKPQDVR
jgi:hypothetical protein